MEFNSLVLALTTSGIITVSVVGAVLLACTITFCIIFPVGLWWKANFSRAHVPLSKIIGMKLRGVNIKIVIGAYILSKRTGVNFCVKELEAHSLAGGNPDTLVRAIVAAKSANLGLSVMEAKAIDLAGRDLNAAIQDAIVPRVIETGEIDAMSKDGVELHVKGSATLKCNIRRLLGGADYNTTMSRISEGIASTIGSAKSYNVVVENPDLVSKTVEDMGLDTGTAYEIVSIDIYSVNVGKNIGLRIQQDRAEADAALAKSKSDERLANAQALEQENKAKLQEMRARVVEAEAEVPKALASALASGKLGALDYYDVQKLQNQANPLQGPPIRPIGAQMMRPPIGINGQRPTMAQRPVVYPSAMANRQTQPSLHNIIRKNNPDGSVDGSFGGESPFDF